MIGSFDRFGFLRHQRNFKPNDIPETLAGKTYLITGANSGLGFETALDLATRGAEVWMLCRDKVRGEEALHKVQQQSQSNKVSLSLIDMASFASIRSFVESFPREAIDGLAHNAGLLPLERQESPEGAEITFAAHVLGPQLLTTLLLPKLKKAPEEARVVFVSSGGMYTTKLSLDDLDWKRRKYDGVAAYAQTKRMQVILTEIWKEAEPKVLFYSMHPGWAETPALQKSLPTFYKITKRFLRSAAQGADTIIWLLTGPKQASGTFWFDRTQRNTHYLPWTRESQSQREEFEALVHKAIAHSPA
jgi:dehydrogenase/reductase SDR family member 12